MTETLSLTEAINALTERRDYQVNFKTRVDQSDIDDFVDEWDRDDNHKRQSEIWASVGPDGKGFVTGFDDEKRAKEFAKALQAKFKVSNVSVDVAEE